VSRRLLQIGERRVDLDTGEVGGLGVLRPLERATLRYLAEHPDRAVPVHELLVEVWGYAPTASSRTAYTTIQRLRPLIEPDPHQPRFLLAERGDGYRLTGFRWVDEGPTPTSIGGWGGIPAERDRFVGRVAELAHLAALDRQGVRSITVTGLGGAGKTRLALHFARAHPGRIGFCDLTAARTADQVGHAVLNALGRSDAPPHPVQAAAEALAEAGPGWWVLDNFEQLVAWAEPTLGAWLDAAPHARFLSPPASASGWRASTCWRSNPCSPLTPGRCSRPASAPSAPTSTWIWATSPHSTSC
jgi:hypothetical protein